MSVTAIFYDTAFMDAVTSARRAGIAAIAGGLMAILLTLPFATAFSMAYPGYPLPYWFEAVEPRLGALSSGDLYNIYGRLYNLVYLLFLPAANVLHALHGGRGTRLERGGFKAVITGLLVTFVGVWGDYWANGAGFFLEVLGLPTLGVAMSLYGIALLRSRVLPNWCALMFVLCGPALVGFTLLIMHIPSGPTFPLALTWLAAGGVLILRPNEAR